MALIRRRTSCAPTTTATTALVIASSTAATSDATVRLHVATTSPVGPSKAECVGTSPSATSDRTAPATAAAVGPPGRSVLVVPDRHLPPPRRGQPLWARSNPSKCLAVRLFQSAGRTPAARDRSRRECQSRCRAPIPVMCTTAMSACDHVAPRANLGAFRFVVLAFALIGLLAARGDASHESGATRCHSSLAVPEPVAVIEGNRPASAAVVKANDHSAAVDGTFQVANAIDDNRRLMTCCLLALLGGLVVLTLRLVRMSVAPVAASSVQCSPIRERAARAPPRCLFLSLCVFRL